VFEGLQQPFCYSDVEPTDKAALHSLTGQTSRQVLLAA